MADYSKYPDNFIWPNYQPEAPTVIAAPPVKHIPVPARTPVSQSAPKTVGPVPSAPTKPPPRP